MAKPKKPQILSEVEKLQPEFKPGNKPYLQFGNEILNNNVPWSKVLKQVLNKSNMTKSKIAAKLGTSINALDSIVDGNNCPITFKQGAMLLAMSRGSSSHKNTRLNNEVI